MASNRKSIRNTIDQVLKDVHFEARVQELIELPARKVINPLFGHLCDPDEGVKRRAVRAIGAVVGELAEQDLESARVIVRRLMWNLNEESGCMAWGAPEALGEIMAASERLAKEYVHVLVSYIREDGNFLEYEPLQQSVLLGILRLAEVRPDLLKSYAVCIRPYLQSENQVLRRLAAKILGLIE